MQYINQQTFDFLQNLDSLHCILVLTTHGREHAVASNVRTPCSLSPWHIYDTKFTTVKNQYRFKRLQSSKTPRLQMLLIWQSKHILWIFKRTVSMGRFFRSHTTYVITDPTTVWEKIVWLNVCDCSLFLLQTRDCREKKWNPRNEAQLLIY